MIPCRSCGASLAEDARFCSTCGAEQDRPSEPSEERKIATVLFADLVGSTALAHEEDPERVRALLDRFYEAMSEEIERTGGTVEKFAGDAVMAAFGVPAALEDHSERALHAALAMQRRVGDLYEERMTLRIGVSTGEVVVGRAREGSSFVTGDAVNVGARLEQAAGPREILAGERTVASARGAFEFGEGRVVKAKGKPEGVACRPVLRALTLQRPRGLGGLPDIFVGRGSELDVLLATFRRAVAQGEPHLVTIVGEPGVGKTRLVRELWELLAEEDPVPLRRTGRCLAYGDGITYWALGEVLKEHFAILENDGPNDILARLGDNGILGLALGLDVAGSRHPLEARSELQAGVVRFLEGLAGERPTVLLVEDLHWAEDDLLDLVDRIVRDVRAPLVVLATARPELLDRRPAWGGGHRNTSALWLEPLQAADASHLVDELLAAELPVGLRDLVVERAEGNPFFVEELLGTLLDAGVLARENGRLAVHETPEGFILPDSVHAVLAARMDRLAPLEKAALQAASVVGRVFWEGPVVHLLGGEEPDFGLLEARDFVRRRGGSSMSGEREYSIRHALTREVAYASIPKSRRGRLHAAFADWLAGTDRARDEHASLLAYHYAEAVRPEDADLAWAGDTAELERLRAAAVSWLRRAGELARGRYEIDEAVQLFTRAVELVADPGTRAELWREAAMSSVLKYDAEPFVEAMERSLEAAREASDSESAAESASRLAFESSIRAGMWVRRPDSELFERWVSQALELAEPGTEQRARALLAQSMSESGRRRVVFEGTDWPEIEEAATEALRISEGLGNDELVARALEGLASIAYDRGRFDEAAALAERGRKAASSATDPDLITGVLETYASVVAAVGRYEDARGAAEAHVALSASLSPHHRVHAISLHVELGEGLAEWDVLRQRTPAVIEAVDDNAATPCLRNARSLLVCALAHLCLGDEGEAAQLEERVAALGFAGYEVWTFGPEMRMALVRQNLPEVERLLGNAPSRSYVFGGGQQGAWLDALVVTGRREEIEKGVEPFLAPGTYIEPFALRALGYARRDEVMLERAQELFAAGGLDWFGAQTEQLLAGRSRR